MRISPITTTNQQSIKKHNTFGMSLFIPKGTRNVLDANLRGRIIDPIEWLAVARALENDRAHYEILLKGNRGFFETTDKFIITRHGDDVQARVASADSLLAEIQSLDSNIYNEVQIQKRIVDNNISKTIESISQTRPTITPALPNTKPMDILENPHTNNQL